MKISGANKKTTRSCLGIIPWEGTELFMYESLDNLEYLDLSWDDFHVRGWLSVITCCLVNW